MKIDDLEQLPETTTIDASSIGIVQVNSPLPNSGGNKIFRPSGDVAFLVCIIDKHGLIGKEVLLFFFFFKRISPRLRCGMLYSKQYKQIQISLFCYVPRAYKMEVIIG